MEHEDDKESGSSVSASDDGGEDATYQSQILLSDSDVSGKTSSGNMKQEDDNESGKSDYDSDNGSDVPPSQSQLLLSDFDDEKEETKNNNMECKVNEKDKSLNISSYDGRGDPQIQSDATLSDAKEDTQSSSDEESQKSKNLLEDSTQESQYKASGFYSDEESQKSKNLLEDSTQDSQELLSQARKVPLPKPPKIIKASIARKQHKESSMVTASGPNSNGPRSLGKRRPFGGTKLDKRPSKNVKSPRTTRSSQAPIRYGKWQSNKMAREFVRDQPSSPMVQPTAPGIAGTDPTSASQHSSATDGPNQANDSQRATPKDFWELSFHDEK